MLPFSPIYFCLITAKYRYSCDDGDQKPETVAISWWPAAGCLNQGLATLSVSIGDILQVATPTHNVLELVLTNTKPMRPRHAQVDRECNVLKAPEKGVNSNVEKIVFSTNKVFRWGWKRWENSFWIPSFYPLSTNDGEICCLRPVVSISVVQGQSCSTGTVTQGGYFLTITSYQTAASCSSQKGAGLTDQWDCLLIERSNLNISLVNTDIFCRQQLFFSLATAAF